MIQNEDLLAFFEEEYRREYGTRRDIRPGDRLYDDLKIESLFVTELLVALEDMHDLRLLHDPRVWKVRTVGEMLGLIPILDAEQHPAAAVGSAA
jgi:acyl carrier protein